MSFVAKFETFLNDQIERFVESRIDWKPPSNLETHIYGNSNGPILFFIHGFPDNHSLWKHQISFFERDFLCVSITLPNFNANDIQNNYGWDWNLIAKLIAQKVKEILKEYKQTHLTLVMHDFGTIYGFMAYELLQSHSLSNAEYISRLVFIDVGDGGELSTYQTILFLFYHFYLLFAFFMPAIIGKIMIFVLCFIPGSPLCREWRFKELSNAMCYPYFHLWRRRLGYGRDENGKQCNVNQLIMYDIPNVPIFFGFGKQFCIQFHSKRWKNELQNRKDCYYKAFDCGHWVMVEKHQEFNHDLKQWLFRN